MSGPAVAVLWARSLVPAWVPFTYAFGLYGTFRIVGRARLQQQELVTLLLLVVGGALVYLALRRRKAEVGTEAIRIRWLWNERVLPFTSVRRAIPDGKKRVVLTTMSGETLVLSSGYLDAALPRDVLERLWNALAAGAQEGARGMERESLARSGRATAVWRAALREAGSPGSYRRAGFSTDRLCAVAENPGIPAEVRAGAIVALAATRLDPKIRERLRGVAASTVEPSLKRLLEEVARSETVLDDRIVDAALDAVRS